MAKKDDAKLFEHLQNFDKDLEGFEGVNLDTMAIPFIKILQKLSPELDAKDDKYIEGAKEGMLFNTVSQRLYETPLRFVVGKFEHLFIEYLPKRGGFVNAWAPEAVAKLPLQWVTNDEGAKKLLHPETRNVFVETYSYYCLLPDFMDDEVVILSFYSTALKEARRLNRLLFTTNVPHSNCKAMPYFMIWNFELKDMKNDQGSWYGPKITLDTFVNQPQLDYVKEQRAQIPNKQVDYSQLALPESTPTAEPQDVKY